MAEPPACFAPTPPRVTFRACPHCGALVVECIAFDIRDETDGRVRETFERSGEDCPKCEGELEPTAKSLTAGDWIEAGVGVVLISAG